MARLTKSDKQALKGMLRRRQEVATDVLGRRFVVIFKSNHATKRHAQESAKAYKRANPGARIRVRKNITREGGYDFYGVGAKK